MGTNVVALVGAVIVYVISFYFLVIKGKKKSQRFVEKAKEEGCCAKATFVDSHLHTTSDEDGTNSRTIVDVKYAYEVNGKTYYKKKTFIDDVLPDYPLEIEIYYDKNRPKKSITEIEASVGRQRKNGIIWTFLIFLFTYLIIDCL